MRICWHCSPLVGRPALFHNLTNFAVVLALVLTEEPSCLGIRRGIRVWVTEQRLQIKKKKRRGWEVRHYLGVLNASLCFTHQNSNKKLEKQTKQAFFSIELTRVRLTVGCFISFLIVRIWSSALSHQVSLLELKPLNPTFPSMPYCWGSQWFAELKIWLSRIGGLKLQLKTNFFLLDQ